MPVQPLISAQELHASLDDPRLVLLDVRSHVTDDGYGRSAYAEGHIPGARYADLHDDVAGCCSGTNGRHPLPDSGRFCVNMRRLGLNPDSTVVVYDDGSCSFAARLWFTLRWVGFENVRVLDGGVAAWRNAGFFLTQTTGQWEAGTYRAQTPLERVFDDDFVEHNLLTGDYTLIDARSAARYRGENETIDPVGGHIPGSLNRPSADNLDANGCFKAPEVLAAEFGAVIGSRDPANIIHSCGSGVTACCNHLAMTVAGMPAAGVYIGSWSEWVSDEGRAIATGPNP